MVLFGIGLYAFHVKYSKNSDNFRKFAKFRTKFSPGLIVQCRHRCVFSHSDFKMMNLNIAYLQTFAQIYFLELLFTAKQYIYILNTMYKTHYATQNVKSS